MVLAGLALVACAMFSVPSFATTTDPGLYAVSVEPLDLAVLDEAIDAPDAVFVNQPQPVDRYKQRSPGIRKPVYAESFQTDGRSLRSYHWRC
jgi:hypothetical protein